MTLSDLTAACIETSSRLSGDAPVVVAGHGAVRLVTRAYIETGQPVMVLYVDDDRGTAGEEQRPAADTAPGDDPRGA